MSLHALLLHLELSQELVLLPDQPGLQLAELVEVDGQSVLGNEALYEFQDVGDIGLFETVEEVDAMQHQQTGETLSPDVLGYDLQHDLFYLGAGQVLELAVHFQVLFRGVVAHTLLVRLGQDVFVQQVVDAHHLAGQGTTRVVHPLVVVYT